jgi:hypothetical protein
MTGTAVNPLFRAAYLAKAGDWEVTLVVPWLSKGDQMLVYPNKMKFGSPAEQEGYVRRWLEERTGALPRFNINFYPAKVTLNTSPKCVIISYHHDEILCISACFIVYLIGACHIFFYKGSFLT